MKGRMLFALSLVFSLAAPAVLAQDADEIVAKGLEALGGVKKLKSIQSRRSSGTITVSGGAASGPFTLIQKRPNLSHFEADLLGNLVVQAYDGKEAWQIQPAVAGGSGKPEAMPEQQAKAVVQRADFDSPLMDYRKKGHQIELIGKEEVDGKPAYHLKLIPKEGSDIHYFMDAQTYLVFKTIIIQFSPLTGSDDEFEILTSDYREVEGVKVPHLFETRNGGTTFNRLDLEKIEFNVEVDPQIFSRPEASSTSGSN